MPSQVHFEQKYILMCRNTANPRFSECEDLIRFKSENNSKMNKKSLFYCSVGGMSEVTSTGRILAYSHYKACLYAGIKIKSYNFESESEWKFEIGPCESIEACDHLIMARFILHRIGEDFNTIVRFSHDSESLEPPTAKMELSAHMNNESNEDEHKSEESFLVINFLLSSLPSSSSSSSCSASTCLNQTSSNHSITEHNHKIDKQPIKTNDKSINTDSFMNRFVNKFIVNSKEPDGCFNLKYPCTHFDPYDNVLSLFDLLKDNN